MRLRSETALAAERAVRLVEQEATEVAAGAFYDPGEREQIRQALYRAQRRVGIRVSVEARGERGVAWVRRWAGEG